MTEWEDLLGIEWPRGERSVCDRSGECCRGAAQIAPWERLLVQATQGDETARNFISQYIPYQSLVDARSAAPDAVAASVEIAESRGEQLDDLVFYHCRFLRGRSECAIYEDRPGLCREYPESPFGAVARCCGYAGITRRCREQIQAMRNALTRLKKARSMLQ